MIEGGSGTGNFEKIPMSIDDIARGCLIGSNGKFIDRFGHGYDDGFSLYLALKDELAKIRLDISTTQSDQTLKVSGIEFFGKGYVNLSWYLIEIRPGMKMEVLKDAERLCVADIAKLLPMIEEQLVSRIDTIRSLKSPHYLSADVSSV